LKGDYGQSRFTDIDGSYRLSEAGRGTLQLRVRGEINLVELREQLKQGTLPAQVAKIDSAIQEVGIRDVAGKGNLDVAVDKAPEAEPHLEGNNSLDTARLPFDSFLLSHLQREPADTPTPNKTHKIRPLIV